MEILDVQTSNADPNALYVDGSRPMQAPLVFSADLSSESTGLFKATVPWDAQYDLFAFDPTYEAIKLSPTVASLGFEAGHLAIYGYGTIRYIGENTYISFEERSLGGDGWITASVVDDPMAIMNRSYADNRYVRPDAVTSQLVFDNALSQPDSGLFKAYAPWDGVYDFFLFDEDEEAIHLSNGQAGFFPTQDLYIFGSTVGDNNGGGRIDFAEYSLKGNLWGVDSVGPYDECIISRGFADNRYVLQSAGITTNYTVQAGDVLQIQNGVITAINP
ncbi:MAG: hypothetical protein JXR25_05105 [Pontiellaceae bacterium]|nr:hypothetical protein [Pontiellaceae bacterium]MBN2784186.1 hypothetical protein [Pontiellaceae bacterium]